MSMVLEGPSIKDQMADTTPASIANAQTLKFNCIKDNRAHPTTGLVTARHSAVQETPVPTYVGMMMHAHTRKRELVDRLSHLGMSISYTRVIELSAQMGNSACQQFHREQVVCSPKDAQQCLHNDSHRQYRPQCQRQRNGYSMAQLSPSSSTLFHWRRSGPKYCNRWWF